MFSSLKRIYFYCLGSLIDPDHSKIEVWFKDFLSDFHLTHLRPLGFKKRRGVLKRDKGAYVEYYYFINFPRGERNREHIGIFLLRAGVRFKTIEHQKHNFWILGGDCQWGRPMNEIVFDSPRLNDYNIFTNKAKLKNTLQRYIIVASEKISQDIDKIYEAVIAKKGFEYKIEG
ncbi:MAG: hypothetical protein HZB50_11385 [Chloroflexi bacterium]|nr:hypothetical protein [Chloroflexota bacterium]